MHAEASRQRVRSCRIREVTYSIGHVVCLAAYLNRLRRVLGWVDNLHGQATVMSVAWYVVGSVMSVSALTTSAHEYSVGCRSTSE